MYERDDAESSAELSPSGPPAERASDASSSSSLLLLLLCLLLGRGLLLPLLPFLPTERHAPPLPLPLLLLVPASSLSSSPLFWTNEWGSGRWRGSWSVGGGGERKEKARGFWRYCDAFFFRCCLCVTKNISWNIPRHLRGADQGREGWRGAPLRAVVLTYRK